MMCFMLALQRRHQMENKRKYHIIIGSKAFFDANLPEFAEEDDIDMFLELVKSFRFGRSRIAVYSISMLIYL